MFENDHRFRRCHRFNQQFNPCNLWYNKDFADLRNLNYRLSSLKSSISCCSSAARFCWALESNRGRKRSGCSSLMPMMGCENEEVSSPQVIKYLAFFITTPIFLRWYDVMRLKRRELTISTADFTPMPGTRRGQRRGRGGGVCRPHSHRRGTGRNA